jgi:hypothetical protein
MTGSFAKIRASFEFLQERAKRKATFTVEDLSRASGWTEYNARMNISKRLKSFVAKGSPQGTFKPKSKILDVSYQDYSSLFRQADVLAPEYDEHVYGQVLVVELFLPLSCEDKLRKALDRLFYKNMVREKLQIIGVDRLRKIFAQQRAESEDSYFERLCAVFAEYFGGYSISHVQGRFRFGNLLTRTEAFEAGSRGDEYLLDETTAAVKFIVPLQSSESIAVNEEEAHATQLSLDMDMQKAELEQIEWLFRHIFVSTILNTVGQAEIWVLETGAKSRLNKYVAEGTDN